MGRRLHNHSKGELHTCSICSHNTATTNTKGSCEPALSRDQKAGDTLQGGNYGVASAYTWKGQHYFYKINIG